jgi:putative addiction module killer protein
MIEPASFRVLQYQTADHRRPFEEWLDRQAADARTYAAIQSRLDRIERGLLGDWKSVGDGVFELRIDHGPGHRIYFGRDGQTVIVLLCGGDKGAQGREIRAAKTYWRDYEKRLRPAGRPT